VRNETCWSAQRQPPLAFGYPHPETPAFRTGTREGIDDPAGMSGKKGKLIALLAAAAPLVAAILVALNAGTHGG
jgi:hypothetical protein